MPEPASASLRQLTLPTFMPSLMNGIAMSMLIPVLPLYLRDTGLSLGATSAVLGAAGLGAMMGGLPAGVLIARLSERQVKILALSIMALTVTTLGWIDAALTLIAFRLMFGLALVGFRLGIQSHVTRVVKLRLRGRAMAYLGGSNRLAYFVGPLVGGFLLQWTNYRTTFAASGIITALGILGAASTRADGDLDAAAMAVRPGVIRSVRTHGRRLLMGGLGAALIVTAREGRYVVLPLIADDLGLSPSAVGVMVGIGTGAELVLFPLSGHLMDRHGRLFAIVPAFSLMAIGLILLAVADSAFLVALASAIAGIGNGLGSGTLRTLSSDLAPIESPAPFLAGMLALQDLGRIGGPLLVGFTASIVGLGGSAAVLAAILIAGIAYLAFVVGETRPADEMETNP